MKRISTIFRAKANRALDAAEDPRETLDYSYQRQLEMLTKVRRGVADVATSRKRIELQRNQLQTQADKLTEQAQKALAMGREDLAREALTRKSGAHRADRRPGGPARPAAGRGGEAHPRLPAAAGQGRVVPHPQGDDQGDLHRRRGADPHRRGVLRHLRGDGRRRHGGAARRGQDPGDAGPGRRHRRADRLRRARRRQLGQPRRRHQPRAGVDERPVRRRGRAGRAQGQRARRRSTPPRPPPPSAAAHRGLRAGSGGEGTAAVIVRILGEGQLEVADDQLDALNELDRAVEAAVEAGDEAAFASALAALLDGVRRAGHPARRGLARRLRPDPAARGRDHRRGPRAAQRRRPDPGLKLPAPPTRSPDMPRTRFIPDTGLTVRMTAVMFLLGGALRRARRRR